MRRYYWLGFFAVLALLIAISSGCSSSDKTLAALKDDKKKEVVPVKTEYSPKVGYVGSEVCGDCHAGEYANWSKSLHSQMLKDPKKDPNVMVADFTKENNPLDFEGVKGKYTKDDIVLTIGGNKKQRYVVQDGEAWRILPYEWIVKTGTWQEYHKEDWNQLDYKDLCISCHSTGYDAKTREFKEMGVGCEACHGPGENHAKSEEAKDIVNPAKLSVARQTDVCSQCHIRGENTKVVREDAYGFLPGNTLTDFYKAMEPQFKPDEKHFYEDGGSKSHHQQYNDFVQSKHFKSGLLSCSTCHDNHTPDSPHLKVSTEQMRDLCASCHYDEFKDIPADQFEIEKYMPKRAKSAVPGDMSAHTFRLPEKEGE